MDSRVEKRKRDQIEMDTLPIQIKQHSLIKNHKIKNYEWSWGVTPVASIGDSYYTYLRERYMYLTVELESGEVFNFKKDTRTNNVYLI